MSLQQLKPNGYVSLSRDVSAVQVPQGCEAALVQGTEVQMVHELGGDFTVRTRRGNMFRIDGAHADALGVERRCPGEVRGSPGLLSETQLEVEVESKLRTCFDPEIPVNIVDLGLVYESVLELVEGDHYRVQIKMTLTAPGCGMGQVIVDDVKRKVEGIGQIDSAEVDLVFYPPWEPGMMSEEARFAAGLW